MANVVIMPRLSLNEDSSMLSQWYVSEGDKVAVGDKLFCIETDKSTMDVESEFAGTVLKKYYGDDEVVDVLTPVCIIGAEGEEAPSLEHAAVAASGEAPIEEVKAESSAPAGANLDGMNVVIMPRLSLNDETSLLSEWYVSEGDTVAVGDRLFSIETDKSSMDVEAEFAGVVLKKYYGNDEVVDVLTPVCVIGEAGKTAPELSAIANAAAAPAEAEESAKAPAAAAGLPAGCDAVIMPRLSLNDETCMLSEWYVSEGDKVAVGDRLFSIETDKSSMDVESEFAGTVLKKYYGNDEVVDVLTPVCVIGAEGIVVPELAALTNAAAPVQEVKEEAPKAAAPAPAPKKEAAVVTTEWRGISPRAKKLAAEKGIKDFSRMTASGAENRILEEDVIRFLESGAATGEKTVVKLPKIRKVIAKNMMNSLQSTAQLTMSSVFNASGIQACRERFKNEQGAMKGVTIGDLILFAVARTLNEFPYMNAWMPNDEEAIEFSDVNLGCAVDTERGLMVPTIMNAGRRSLLDISNDLKDMAAACRTGNISPDKLKEGTFTVSNLGAFGIRTFTPVLNPPQVGILGVGAIDYMMKKTKDGFTCYPGCSLSLTVDHRYVDGGPAARFLKKLCENLENIEALIEE